MRCRHPKTAAVGECTVREPPMTRLAAILLAVTGTVALQVVAQAILLACVRFIDRRTRGATEIRRTFWISLGAVVPLFFGHFAQVGLWAGFLRLLGALKTYDDAFYFSLVTFATLGYGDIVLAPGYRIFGALAATCGSLMLGWSTALIFAAISRARATADGSSRSAVP
jgi:voltage-gated potassium channel